MTFEYIGLSSDLKKRPYIVVAILKTLEALKKWLDFSVFYTTVQYSSVLEYIDCLLVPWAIRHPSTCLRIGVLTSPSITGYHRMPITPDQGWRKYIRFDVRILRFLNQCNRSFTNVCQADNHKKYLCKTAIAKKWWVNITNTTSATLSHS